MPLFALLLFAVLSLVFVALNWPAIVTPLSVSFGFLHAEAPLGLILLALAALEAVLFLGYIAWLQGAALLESRRKTRALEEARTLAERAEVSRLAEVKQWLQAALDAQAAQQHEAFERLARQQQEASNTLAASLGELEDRLERQWGAPRS